LRVTRRFSSASLLLDLGFRRVARLNERDERCFVRRHSFLAGFHAFSRFLADLCAYTLRFLYGFCMLALAVGLRRVSCFLEHGDLVDECVKA
jgi:hypothetical protein